MTNNLDNKLVTVLYAQHCNPSIKSKNPIVNKYFPIIFESVINNYNGKIQKETTVTFSAITYAVKCAIELQKTIRKWNLFPMPVRILVIHQMNLPPSSHFLNLGYDHLVLHGHLFQSIHPDLEYHTLS